MTKKQQRISKVFYIIVVVEVMVIVLVEEDACMYVCIYVCISVAVDVDICTSVLLEDRGLRHLGVGTTDSCELLYKGASI